MINRYLLKTAHRPHALSRCVASEVQCYLDIQTSFKTGWSQKKLEYLLQKRLALSYGQRKQLVSRPLEGFFQYVTSHVLHIEAMDKVEAFRFTDHVGQRSAHWEVKALETNENISR